MNNFIVFLFLFFVVGVVLADSGHPMLEHDSGRDTIEELVEDIEALPYENRENLLKGAHKLIAISTMEQLYDNLRNGEIKNCAWTQENPSPRLEMYFSNGQFMLYRNDPQCRPGEQILWLEVQGVNVPFMSLYCGNLYEHTVPQDGMNNCSVVYTKSHHPTSVGFGNFSVWDSSKQTETQLICEGE